jgi:hypothetical protein
MAQRASALAVAALAALTTSQLALADDPPALEIFAVSSEVQVTWDDVLREVQDSPATLGRTYTLGVRPARSISGFLGTRYGCEDYKLSFDAVGQAAFSVLGCDPATGMSRVRVASRDALFDQTSFVPRPLRASVYAVLLQRARADGGGTRPEGGSRVGCSVRLEPYLWDSLHARPVALPWDRFELRPLSGDIHAAPDGSGWIARGESRMSVRFRYEVIDRATGERVVDNEATLMCEDKAVSPPQAGVLPGSPPSAPPLAAHHPEPPDVPVFTMPPVSPGEASDHSFASLKLKVLELGLRNDAPRFRGLFQLAPYNGSSDFAGGLQIGVTNTAGLHPWGLPGVRAARGKNHADVDDVASHANAFRGFAQVGAINAVDGDFSGALQFGAVASFVEGSFRGFAQIGVLAAGAGEGSVAALQFGGFAAYATEIAGVQLSPCIVAAERVRGLQVGGCAALATKSVTGLQISGGNMVFEDSKHRGETAPPAVVTGAQIGAWNYASEIHGVQISAGNAATTVRGLQIGVFNYAKNLHGIQIGAINIAANGVVPFMPVLNAAFSG